MRALGMGERALALMIERASARHAFGRTLSEQGVVREWIAEARIQLEALRLLVLKTAWLMDTVGNKHAMTEIQAIKIAVPRAVQQIIDRAIQLHGGAGVSSDTPLAELYAGVRSLRIADGPDEVHLAGLGRAQLRGCRPPLPRSPTSKETIDHPPARPRDRRRRIHDALGREHPQRVGHPPRGSRRVPFRRHGDHLP